MKYSVIVPVYNRPDEVDELLESLCSQTFKDFEVVIVEDGSKITCKDVCDKYANILDLQYYYKENSGPGQSRNYGVERAKGDYVLIVDSDAVAPAGYLQAIDDELRRQPSDAWGGPDAAHDSFTDPRSFNLGIRREAYLALGGFSKTRFSKMSLYGEDIDFSIRIYKAGYSCRLFPEAWVWHKRRTDFRKFWRQVYNSGYARINLWRMYPEALKPVHALPSLFTIGVAGLVVLAPFTCGWSLVLLLLYALLILLDSSIQSKSLKVGFLAIAAVFVQLIGYGVGFLESWWTNCVRKHG